MTKVQKTKQYEIFNLRTDNRAKGVDQVHVQKLVESIQSRNLLFIRPISVNGDMEIIDGQHRLAAAKQLGVDIYYIIEESLAPEDIVRMNISKTWGSNDFLNFYVKHRYPEYIALDRFVKDNQIPLKVALSITMGDSKTSIQEFKFGKFKFSSENTTDELETCWNTIRYVKKMNGYSGYTESARFWKALLKLIKHHRFNAEIWKKNLERMIDRMTPRASSVEYMRMLMDIYNYRANEKINILEESYE